VILEGERDPTV
jgi:hypothetical protein